MTKLNASIRTTLAALAASLLCTTLALTVASAVPGNAAISTSA